jgi:phage terminase large subunit-like protein
VRGQFAFTETLHVFMALTAMHPEAKQKLVEDKANGTAVLDTLRRKVPGMIDIEPEGGKYVRAAAVSWRHEAKNVILPASDTIPCPEGYRDEAGEWHVLEPTTVADWLHEHASFPTGTKDDQVDAMSQALTWANPQARLNVEQQPPGLPKPGTVMGNLFEVKW